MAVNHINRLLERDAVKQAIGKDIIKIKRSLKGQGKTTQAIRRAIRGILDHVVKR